MTTSRYNPLTRKRWYDKNKDQLNAKARARYPLNREKMLAGQRASRLRHHEQRLAEGREYRERNREQIRAYGRSRARTAARLLTGARRRAKVRGLPCTISIADIQAVYGDRCPVFGLSWGEGRRLGPSLDCILPALGYVPGNIAVISGRANTMKSDATLAEIERLVEWLKRAI